MQGFLQSKFAGVSAISRGRCHCDLIKAPLGWLAACMLTKGSSLFISPGTMMLTAEPHALQHSNPGNIFVNLSRQLVDGHWVLSFATPERAMLAKEMVDQHAKQLRTLYADALAQIAMCPQ